MEYTRLGSTGLEISRLCLGCMSFGEPDRGQHAWTLPEDRSIPILKKAVDAGVTFFDTANVYSDGSSEEILGRFLRQLNRDEIVVATKVNGRMHAGPNGAGLSRKAIMAQVDASLRRLGLDHVDLYQIHRFDPHTPFEETMEALHDVVRAGKARYLGASSMWAWQFASMQHAADLGGWTRFVSMQNQLNLLYREEEREMIPLCANQGVGLIPWSPQARGRLARPFGESTARLETDEFGKTLVASGDEAVVSAVEAVAGARGVEMSTVALAWVLAQPQVDAPIVGVTRPEQLDAALAALDLSLSASEVDELESPYQVRAATGF